MTDTMTEEGVEADAAPVSDGRIELPRGNWVKFRDPWELSDREFTAIRVEMIHRRRPSATTSLSTPVPPQLGGASNEDEGETLVKNRENGRHLLASIIVGWGGPQLDGKPVSAETLHDLPAPLTVAITKASGPVIRELTGAPDPNEDSPTTP